MPGSIHFILMVKSKEPVRNELVGKIVEKLKLHGKQASCLTLNFANENKHPELFAKVCINTFGIYSLYFIFHQSGYT